jgi:hypothetical protein
MQSLFGTGTILAGHNEATRPTLLTLETTVTTGGEVSAGVDSDYSYSRTAGVDSYNGFTYTCSGGVVPSITLVDSPNAIVVGNAVYASGIGVSAPFNAHISVPGDGTYLRTGVAGYADGIGTNEPTGYTTGSLAAHIDDSIWAMMGGLSPTDSTMRLFSSAVHSTTTPSATANPNLWCSSLDLSWIGFARTNTGYWGAYPQAVCGHLVAPNIVISAHHVWLSTGKSITFRRPDGSFQTQTIVADLGDADWDWRVGILDAPITGITPVKIVPTGWETKIPLLTDFFGRGYPQPGIPMMMKAVRRSNGSIDNVVRLVNQRYGHAFGGVVNHNGYPFDGSRNIGRYSSWRWTIQGGDSSSATFFPVNGECCLWGLQYSAGGGPAMAAHRTAIEAAMTTLAGTSTTFSTVDLSGFTTF